MRLRQIWDNWSFYDFKSTFDETHSQQDACIPSWVPPADQRRLEAYKMLDGYYRNAARFWLGPEAGDDAKKERREYGDPYLIVEAVRSSILGNDQKISVDGAVDNPNGPEADLEKKLSDWMEKERLVLKANEGERDATKLGDAVYVLGWDDKKKRPRLRVYDPGWYFPVLMDNEGDTGDYTDADMLDEDFPEKVHIAYEFLRRVGNKDHRIVRRITWELREVPPVKYPWNDRASEYACFMWDGEWDLESQPNFSSMIDLSWDSATRKMVDERNLGIDFIPVIHIPNTISEKEHFGTSSLANVMQIFDDMASTDTDLQAASGTTGSPPLALSGAQGEDVLSYGPGTVFNVGDGKMDVLDTSRSLDALIKYKNELADRLSINSRTPRTLLGAVDPSKVPSGIVLTLSFSPHSRMVNEMRLIRNEKYGLMLRMVSRFYMADNQVAEIFPAKLIMGSYLPADKTEAVNNVVAALAAHAMSHETALKVLMEAGYPIDDAVQELKRINENDFDTAVKMLDATADMNAVRERLGLDPLPADQIAPPGNPGSTNPADNNPAGPTGDTQAGFGGIAPFALGQ